MLLYLIRNQRPHGINELEERCDKQMACDTPVTCVVHICS